MFDHENQEISFDCVLPSAIFFNKNLEPACIKAYALIRNLTRMSGYCFASNEYLANLMESDISSIKRWLKNLSKEGFIRIVTDKAGIHWQRKIYLADKFKKCLRKLKIQPPPAQNSAPPSSKMSHIKEEKKNIREEEQGIAQTPKVASPKSPEIQFSFEMKKWENISSSDLSTWKELYPSVDVDRELKAMSEWVLSNPSKSKKLWRKFIINWLSNAYEKITNRESIKESNKWKNNQNYQNKSYSSNPTSSDKDSKALRFQTSEELQKMLSEYSNG